MCNPDPFRGLLAISHTSPLPNSPATPCVSTLHSLSLWWECSLRHKNTRRTLSIVGFGLLDSHGSNLEYHILNLCAWKCLLWANKQRNLEPREGNFHSLRHQDPDTSFWFRTSLCPALSPFWLPPLSPLHTQRKH